MLIKVYKNDCVFFRAAIKRGAELIKDHGGGDLPVDKYEFYSNMLQMLHFWNKDVTRMGLGLRIKVQKYVSQVCVRLKLITAIKGRAPKPFFQERVLQVPTD